MVAKLLIVPASLFAFFASASAQVSDSTVHVYYRSHQLEIQLKNGQTAFDPTYFFNVADYSITGVPGNKVDYLQRMRYAGNGIVYATGNIYALASNPPNYVTDRTYGAFKVDLANKTITKLSLLYSNGYGRLSLACSRTKCCSAWPVRRELEFILTTRLLTPRVHRLS